MNRVTLYIILMLGLLNKTYAQTNGDILFDDTFLHELRITSGTEPNLFSLLQGELALADRPYHLVSMELDGELIDSIGIRVKGVSSTSIGDRPPFKLDINEYVDGQTFDGIKKINLANSFGDPEKQRDRVANELFRRSGVAAPRSAYTEVYINDVFINVYVLIEQVDKTFIFSNFSDKGNLLKINELIYGDDVFTDFNALSSEDRLESVNLRNYFKFMLINNIIEAADNYPINNYYLHYSEKGDKYQYIPWDNNFCMQAFFAQAVSDSIEPAADMTAIWNNPDIKEVYLEVACELYNYLLDETYIEESLTENETQILSNSQGLTLEELLTASEPPIIFGDIGANHLIDYLNERRGWILEQLDNQGYDCNDFSYPHNPGDLVINEFVAASDSIGGIQEPDGGTPDWIELYNNSENDIVLDHNFYISDDIDFPKKWNFKTPVTIAADGYHIIWADRDIQQQGVHANFKIEKSAGDLMIVYEDLTVIDMVSYSEQELNMGYARVPNGTGDFTIQDPTFNVNNSSVTNIFENNLDLSIQLHPNPAKDYTIWNAELPINQIQIYNLAGQLLFAQKNPEKRIDLSNLPSGFLIVRLIANNNIQDLKLVKY